MSQENIPIKADDFFSRYAYESLILQQPHILFQGLWSDGNHFYIVCPELFNDIRTKDNEPISDWFDNKCRPITCPIKLISEKNIKHIRVPDRTAMELAQQHGEPKTISDLYRELTLLLPKDFPLVSIDTGPKYFVANIHRKLTEDEKSILHITCADIKLWSSAVISTKIIESQANVIERKKQIVSPDTLSLHPSKLFNTSFPKLLVEAVEEDEDFWVDNRIGVLTSQIAKNDSFLPKAFSSKTSACFIDAAAFPTKNIRTYLPIYQRIIIGMPLQGNLQDTLNSLSISEGEIIELATRNRVQFIAPQSIQRYPCRFMNLLLEANSNSILFSRRLASATVIQTRNKLPILYPPFNNVEKYELLRLFSSIDDPRFRPIANVICNKIGSIWVGMEQNLSARGAMGTGSHGIGRLLGDLLYQFSGNDNRIELYSCGASVEWANALHATYSPIEVDGYSEFIAAQWCASLFSGVNSSAVSPIEKLDSFIQGLLTLNNDAPVLEIDNIFTHSDIDRLGKLLNGITPDDDKEVILRSMNEKVQRFESNQNRLERLDIFGLGGVAAATAATGNPYIPFGVWLMQYVLKNADPSRDIGGKAIDWLRAANSFTSSESVLISRLRSKVKGIKY